MVHHPGARDDLRARITIDAFDPAVRVWIYYQHRVEPNQRPVWRAAFHLRDDRLLADRNCD